MGSLLEQVMRWTAEGRDGSWGKSTGGRCSIRAGDFGLKNFGPAFWRARERLGGGEKLRIHRGVALKKGQRGGSYIR